MEKRLYQSIMKLKCLCFILICAIISYKCSEDLSLKVDDILLTVDKNVALSEGDTVRILTEVHNHIDERLTGIPLTYYANETVLDGPFFYPTTTGSFVIRAEYEDVVSKGQLIEVISLEDNITSLGLIYEGNRWLTTEIWSLSGSFSFDVTVDNLNFQVSTKDISLLLNGRPISERAFLYFSDPGEYEFTAGFKDLRSEPVTLFVRDRLEISEMTIPVVFHYYRLDYQPDQVNRLIDTLNGAFNIDFYDPKEVRNGSVNPNAVNMKLKFEPATVAPDGFILTAPGVHTISQPVAGDLFSKIAPDNTWDPETYVNVWIADGQIEIEEDFPSSYVFYGRGEVSEPKILQEEIPGLITLDKYQADTIAGIIVNAASVFGEHPDYIVTTMGHYFGLLTTFEFDCRHEGDYCPDTRTIDFANTDVPTDIFKSCDGTRFKPSNFMSINRNYRDFTYDQALRVREVLKYGISRPGGE